MTEHRKQRPIMSNNSFEKCLEFNLPESGPHCIIYTGQNQSKARNPGGGKWQRNTKEGWKEEIIWNGFKLREALLWMPNVAKLMRSSCGTTEGLVASALCKVTSTKRRVKWNMTFGGTWTRAIAVLMRLIRKTAAEWIRLGYDGDSALGTQRFMCSRLVSAMDACAAGNVSPRWYRRTFIGYQRYLPEVE